MNSLSANLALEPLGAGDLIDRAVRLYRRHFTTLIRIAAPPVLVSTGEQVTVTDQEVPKARPANLWAATAWTQQELVFELTPLAEVAQEFNRYNTRKLIISDPILAEFHVTGVFPSADPSVLLRFLRAQPGIDLVEAGGEIRISKK